MMVRAIEKPPGESSMESSSSISYTGANTITNSITDSNVEYSSTSGGQNSLLVSGGSSTLSNITVTKSGDESSENSDFYGTNAAILVYNNATLNISNSSITTSGTHANGVFAYGTGTINIDNTTIKTTNNNSGGIMVTGGGTLDATNLNVETSGNSSAAIRSDRGGGTLTVTGGSYKTTGVGSPSIYSTADITVNDATLTATASEGVVVEGANSITLNNTTLIDTNNTLNGNSTTYKNIFLYQSMSGDADVGTSYFTALNSNIITNKGDTIYVTNTNCQISLTNNKIVNNDGDFLRVEAAAWGTSGSNGGNVKLDLTNQTIEGNIIIDNLSTLDMSMTSSIYKGTINNNNTANNISLTLDNDSIIILTSDCYINSLSNNSSDNNNIYANGYSLYVNNSKVAINENTAPGINEVTTLTDTNNDSMVIATNDDNLDILIKYIIPGVLIIVVIVVGSIIINRRKKLANI